MKGAAIRAAVRAEVAHATQRASQKGPETGIEIFILQNGMHSISHGLIAYAFKFISHHLKTVRVLGFLIPLPCA